MVRAEVCTAVHASGADGGPQGARDPYSKGAFCTDYLSLADIRQEAEVSDRRHDSPPGVSGQCERLAARRKYANLNVVDTNLEGRRLTASQRLTEAFGSEGPDEVHGQGVAGNNAPGWKKCGRHRVPDSNVPGERVGPTSPGSGPKRTPGSARQPKKERAGDGVE